MTDITEQLRSKSPYLHSSSAERVMADAAADIERLRAERDDWYMRALRAEDANERLRAALKDIECHSIDHTEACRMAGLALEQKPTIAPCDDAEFGMKP